MTELERLPGVERVFVALGSNLGDRLAHLESALLDLERLAMPDSRVICSPWYETLPMGPQDQGRYLNGVCRFDTELAALALLDALQSIETRAGRVRTTRRWSARPLDLDLLLYGEHRIDTARLTVPHPGLQRRSFVAVPLLDLEPAIEIPGLGPLSECLVFDEDFDLTPWGNESSPAG